MTNTILIKSLEELFEMGRIAAQHMDTGRWVLGDLALTIETNYAGCELQELARQVNVPYKRCLEYRTVAAFYPDPRRAEFLDDASNITYTHFRTAMKMSDADKAYWFLEKAALRTWTTDYADRVMTRYLGRKKPQKLLDLKNVSNPQFDPATNRLSFIVADAGSADAFVSWWQENRKLLHVVVTEDSGK
jgi:hypothetical protein